MMRDEKMLKFIKDYMPDRKVSILELGSGRGGLSRYLTRELHKEDKLELFVATNISEIENNYNKKKRPRSKAFLMTNSALTTALLTISSMIPRALTLSSVTRPSFTPRTRKN